MHGNSHPSPYSHCTQHTSHLDRSVVRARDWLEAFVSKVGAYLAPSDQSCSGGRKLPFSCVLKLCHLLGCDNSFCKASGTLVLQVLGPTVEAFRCPMRAELERPAGSFSAAGRAMGQMGPWMDGGSLKDCGQ